MKYVVRYNDEVIGILLAGNLSMTDEEICESSGVDLARSLEDFEGIPENRKYDLSDLEIIREKW